MHFRHRGNYCGAPIVLRNRGGVISRGRDATILISHLPPGDAVILEAQSAPPSRNRFRGRGTHLYYFNHAAARCRNPKLANFNVFLLLTTL